MASRPPPPPRLFTLDEARALLPTLRDLLQDLHAARETLVDVERELGRRFGRRPRQNGHVALGHEIDGLNQAAREAQDRVSAVIRSIAELGCELKDLDRGMVDFRTLRDGRVVYLCWLRDEPTIMFWHELEAGFLGRQRL